MTISMDNRWFVERGNENLKPENVAFLKWKQGKNAKKDANGHYDELIDLNKMNFVNIIF